MDFGSLASRMKETFFLVPEEKFDKIASDRNYVDSLIYLAVCVLIGSIIAVPFAAFAYKGGMAAGLVVALIAIPFSLISVPISYIAFGILHLLLKLVGGKGSFLQTVQVFVYGTTGNQLLRGVPLLSFIFSLVALVNVVLGAKRVHRISLLRAVVAVVVVPAIAVALLVVLAIVLLGASMAALGGFAGQY